jgi:hypothetical protein
MHAREQMLALERSLEMYVKAGNDSGIRSITEQIQKLKLKLKASHAFKDRTM